MCEQSRPDDEFAPLRIKSRGRLRSNRLGFRLAGVFEGRHPRTNRNAHVAMCDELTPIPDRPVPRHDDCAVGREREISVCGADHTIDAATRAIIDHRVRAVPPGVAGLQDVGSRQIRKGHRRYVAVRNILADRCAIDAKRLVIADETSDALLSEPA